MEKWKKMSEVSPKVGDWVYFLDNQNVGIVKIVKEIDHFPIRIDGLRDYIDVFRCFDCGFDNCWLEASANLEWANITKERFITRCIGCGAEKVMHICGKDSHPACVAYAEHQQELKNRPISPEKRKKRLFVFYWTFGIITIIILYVIGSSTEFLSARIKKYMYDNIGAPLIKDLSKEAQSVIKSIRVPTENGDQ